MERRKRPEGLIVAERRTTLLNPATAPRNLRDGFVSTRKSDVSDLASTASSDSRADSTALRKPPALMMDVGRFLPVATEYHATPELVVSWKTRSASQSFGWSPVMASTKEVLFTNQFWSLEQN